MAVADLLDDLSSRVQILVGCLFDSRHDRGKGSFVLLLVGQSEGSHGAPVKTGGEADNFTGGRRVCIVCINPSCMSDVSGSLDHLVHQDIVVRSNIPYVQ